VRTGARLTVLVGLYCQILGFSSGSARPRARAVAKAIERVRGCRWPSESETEGLSSLAKEGLLGA